MLNRESKYLLFIFYYFLFLLDPSAALVINSKRNKKACAEHVEVLKLTCNFGNNYASFLSILGYLALREYLVAVFSYILFEALY